MFKNESWEQSGTAVPFREGDGDMKSEVKLTKLLMRKRLQQ